VISQAMCHVAEKEK